MIFWRDVLNQFPTSSVEYLELEGLGPVVVSDPEESIAATEAKHVPSEQSR